MSDANESEEHFNIDIHNKQKRTFAKVQYIQKLIKQYYAEKDSRIYYCII